MPQITLQARKLTATDFEEYHARTARSTMLFIQPGQIFPRLPGPGSLTTARLSALRSNSEQRRVKSLDTNRTDIIEFPKDVKAEP